MEDERSKSTDIEHRDAQNAQGEQGEQEEQGERQNKIYSLIDSWY